MNRGITRDDLVNHFRGVDGATCGLHSTNIDDRCRWVALDIDRHGKDGDPDANLRYALAVARELRTLGFDVLLIDSNGRGGFHLLILLSDFIPATTAYHFARWINRGCRTAGLDGEPECFPKQDGVRGRGKECGNWLRVFGRHHSRDVWSRAWNFAEGRWAEGNEAIDLILAIKPTDPEKIPDEALAVDEEAAEKRTAGGDHKDYQSDSSRGREPTPEVIRRAKAYLRRCDPAIQGQDGSGKCLKIVTHAAVGFDLPDSVAMQVIEEEWNCRCLPPWPRDELEHKLRDAWNNNWHRAGWKIDEAPDAETEPSEEPVPQATKPNESADDPARIARAIVEKFRDGDGHLRIAYHRDVFHVHDGHRYEAKPDFARGEMVRLVKDEIDVATAEMAATWANVPPEERKKSSSPVAKRVTRGLVADVAMHLASMVCIDRDEEPPFWVERWSDDPPGRLVLPMRNGLLDISGDEPELFPHSPRFFCGHVLPYDYDPLAPQPTRWLDFLADQWGEDKESIGAIHEMLGDLLCPDRDLHAIPLVIGPPRSGKGVIEETGAALVGEENTTETSASSLSGRFGLASLVGKKVAFMGDARTGDSSDQAVLLDRLLRLSGGNTMDVDRKGLPMINVRWRGRVVIISNEMPNFRDASGAIVQRYVILQTNREIPPEKRDRGLAASIKRELPGILNLAIRGLQSLRERGRFLQPKSAERLRSNASEMASPVKLFIEECCYLVKDYEVTKTDLFELWRQWCHRRNYGVGNLGTFSKNLYAAFPQIGERRPREGERGRQIPKYTGLQIDEAAKTAETPRYP